MYVRMYVGSMWGVCVGLAAVAASRAVLPRCGSPGAEGELERGFRVRRVWVWLFLVEVVELLLLVVMSWYVKGGGVGV